MHERNAIVTMMELLDEVTTLNKCLKMINTISSPNPIHKRLKSHISKAQAAVKNIKDKAAKLTDKRTLAAHKQMVLADQRPVISKSAPRSSARHAKKIRKRKWVELDASAIKSSLFDLYQSGRLTRPADVCEIILNANKRCRSTMYRIMSEDLRIAAESTLRNNVCKYSKFLQGKALPLKERFGAGGQVPLMPVKEFKGEITTSLQDNPHRQKDLRKLVSTVLNAAKRKKLGLEVKGGDQVDAKDDNKEANEVSKLSPLMRCEASDSTVEKYMRIASTCVDVKHIGKVNHSTRARDTAIRSFRGVCTFIAVVLASQSYPDPAWLGLEASNVARRSRKKGDKDRDIESLFPYPVKWTNPALILNTDETTLVLTKHKKGKSKWVVVSKQFREAKRKNFTQYSIDPDPNQVGVNLFLNALSRYCTIVFSCCCITRRSYVD